MSVRADAGLDVGRDVGRNISRGIGHDVGHDIGHDMSGSASSDAAQPALVAAALLAVDPAGLGGVRVQAQAGPVRDAWLLALRALLPAATPWRRLPQHIG
ncbi:MAG: hypothetical protein LH480_09075, partial [Rubrivivax sp.]|nr:hypothetical protein [Rubrivivax sp.]